MSFAEIKAPDKFRERVSTEHTGANGGDIAITVSDDRRKAALALLLARE